MDLTATSPLCLAEDIHAMAEMRVTPEHCAGHFTELLQILTAHSPSTFNTLEIQKEGQKAIELFFSARLELRRRMRSYSLSGVFPADCVAPLKAALRVLRETEDYIGHVAHLLGRSPVSNGDFGPAGLGRGTLTNLEEGLDITKLKSGDVLLHRNEAIQALSIARMADPDTQFSELALVYVDDHQQIFIIQAVTEKGLIITPFSKFKKIRTTVYRFENEEIASRAAKVLYDVAKKSNLAYDFKILNEDHQELYSGEAIAWAFEQVQVQIPLVSSTFKMRNTHLMSQLGIAVQSGFMPGDIETDPRFSLIAEYRDFAKIREAWRTDAILGGIYRWMENQDYVLYSTKALRHQGRRHFHFRKLPILDLLVKNHFAANLKQESLTTFLTLQETIDGISKVLTEMEKPFTQNYGVPPALPDLAQMLDNLRERDYRSYRTWLQTKKNKDQPAFHRTLH